MKYIGDLVRSHIPVHICVTHLAACFDPLDEAHGDQEPGGGQARHTLASDGGHQAPVPVPGGQRVPEDIPEMKLIEKTFHKCSLLMPFIILGRRADSAQ